MKLAMLISGSGTTAAAILTAIQDGRLSGLDVACVIASKPGIPGIERVKQFGLKDDQVAVIARKDFDSTEEFGEKMLSFLHKHEAEYVGQYGWLV